MKTLKKTLCALFAALTALTLILTGACANSQNSGKIQIVCTIFPQYDWVRELTDGAENVEVTLLEDSGADLHNFQPSAADKVAILNSDLFIYIGFLIDIGLHFYGSCILSPRLQPHAP